METRRTARDRGGLVSPSDSKRPLDECATLLIGLTVATIPRRALTAVFGTA